MLEDEKLKRKDIDCTTKIRILKQITTKDKEYEQLIEISIAPQRYEF